jgi:hypothetical protein
MKQMKAFYKFEWACFTPHNNSNGMHAAELSLYRMLLAIPTF